MLSRLLLTLLLTAGMLVPERAFGCCCADKVNGHDVAESVRSCCSKRIRVSRSCCAKKQLPSTPSTEKQCKCRKWARQSSTRPRLFELPTTKIQAPDTLPATAVELPDDRSFVESSVTISNQAPRADILCVWLI